MPKKKIKGQTQKIRPENIPAKTGVRSFQFPSWFSFAFIFLFSFLLYSNTLWNQYAIDDLSVLTDNKFTKKGFDGIKELFTNDMLMGAFGERGVTALSGGRYRPLSAASFAAEYEIMRRIKGDNRAEINDTNIILGENDPYLSPALSHGINVFLFALTCVIFYYLLMQLLSGNQFAERFSYFPLSAALLFAAHPIHTEVVANIKGRDEILCLLFSLLALLAAVKYAKTQKYIYLAWGSLAYLAALFSKENAITFLAIIPITWFAFTKARFRIYFIGMASFLAAALFFLFFRNKFVHSAITQPAADVLNNPFLYATFSQRYATAFLTFLYYFKLLVFPYRLTSDYYYNQIPYIDLSNPLFYLSLALNGGLLAYALIKLKKNVIPSYAILFYFITLSVTSNLLFSIGALMNERFIYISSIGFCMLLAYLIIYFVQSPRQRYYALAIIAGLYSIKTFDRNFDWKNDRTLFARDVISSPNSAKVQAGYGSELLAGAAKQTDSASIYSLLDSAIVHLKKSLNIYPGNASACFNLGSAIYVRTHRAAEAIYWDEKADSLLPEGMDEVKYNLGLMYSETNQLDKAKDNLLKAGSIQGAKQAKRRYLLAVVYAKLNKPDSVDYWLNLGKELKPIDKDVYSAIGIGFASAHNYNKAVEFLSKAIELSPRLDANLEENLAVAYYYDGKYAEAIAVTENLVKTNPDYIVAYKNLAKYYAVLNNKNLANRYLLKYKEMAK